MRTLLAAALAVALALGAGAPAPAAPTPQPAAAKPATKKPAAKKPAAKKPAANKPVTKKPVTKKPATKKPAPKKPAAKKASPKPKPKPKKTPPPSGPRAFLAPDFRFVVPTGWRLKKLPTTGKPPRETRRVELWRDVENGRATIEVEADRSEPLTGKFPVRDARAAAGRVAATFGFGQYRVVDLEVKQAPGFYETWVVSEVPGRAPFRVVAAHFFRRGTRYRAGAVTPLGDDQLAGEKALRAVLKSWRWR